MPFTPKLTYKGKPLVRKDNELYYLSLIHISSSLSGCPETAPCPRRAPDTRLQSLHPQGAALPAHCLLYTSVVKDGQVIIVDEFTGRLMIGRRYNEGLHLSLIHI